MVGECIESRLLFTRVRTLQCRLLGEKKKKKKNTEDFLGVLIGMSESEREERKKEKKKTNARMDLSDRLLLALSIHGLQSNLKVRCSN